MTRVILFVTASIAIFLVCGVSSEEDYHLPPGPPPTTVLVRRGKALPPPHLRPKYIERYVASELNIFGGHPPLPPPRPLGPPKRFRLPHPNSLPREPKAPFDIVRAPVIYHQTVTDTDVTKAISDAFEVVEKLRKPGKNKGTSGVITTMPVPSPPTVENVVTSYEYVNHLTPQRTTGTTTTTIVDAPQQVEIAKPLKVVQQQQPVVIETGGFLTAPLVQDTYPPIPSAHDLPPLPVSLATAAPLVKQAVVPVVPATTTSTSPTTLVSPSQSASPKLIIPSQSHVTTLAEAVHTPAAGDSQIRTIIQPVYIPYPVDQNGQPVGPLPDYHSMDFGAILSAQNQFVVQDTPHPSPQPQTATNFQVVQQPPSQQRLVQIQQPQQQQLVQIQQPQQQQLVQIQQPQQQQQILQVEQPQQQQQQYFVPQQQQDQVTAGDTTSGGSEESIAPRRASRVIRRRKKAHRRNPARRI